MTPDPNTPARENPTYPQQSAAGPAIRKSWFPLFCFLIVVLSTALQIGCLGNGLVIDDRSLVFMPDERGCGVNPADCFSGKLFGLYYRPVLTASFAVVQMYHIHNDKPIWYHVENLALHAIVVSLALWLFRLMLRRRNAALLAGALFALHPVQVCVTTFVGGRTDTLALLFVLLFSIGIKQAASLQRVSGSTKWLPHRRRKRLCAAAWIMVSLISFLAAVFTKEQVIPLLFITPLLVTPTNVTAWRNRHGDRCTDSTAPLWLGIYVLPIIIFAIASSRVLKGDTLPPTDWSASLHAEMVGRTLWYFAKTLFAPTITTLHQSTLGPWDVPQYGVAVLGILSALIWLAVVSRVWSNRPQRFMALWATLMLASCINIIPIPSQFASPYRAALPLFGFAGLIGSVLTGPKLHQWLGRVFGHRRAYVLGLAILPALAWCIVTSMRDVPNWHDEFVLMKAEVAADPNYLQARVALANYWSYPALTSYRPDLQKSLEEYNICVNQLFGPGVPPQRFAALVRSKAMIRTLASASDVRWAPTVYIPQVLRGRGSVFQALDRYEEAIQDYSSVRELTPKDKQNNDALAYCLRTMGDQLMEDRSFSDAAENYKTALEISPDDRDIRADLVSAYRIIGRKDRADAVERMEDRFTGKVP